MLKVLMGSLEQKMYIAFRVYDIDNDQIISEREVKLVLKGIPIVIEERYGISHSQDPNGQANTNNMSRSEIMNQKYEDTQNINDFVDLVF